jgi:hypothetical protein
LLYFAKTYKILQGSLQMTLFQQTGKALLALATMASTVFALQIEAPPEVAEAVSMYSREAGAENNNATLRVSMEKGADCNAFTFKLISANSGKTIKESEHCFTDLPNTALQNGVFEVFGHSVKTNSEISGNVKTVLIGAVFVAVGILLYYSKPPEPVYIYSNNGISGVAK